MASIIWLDLNGKTHKPRKEFNDIYSLRSYIEKNKDNIKVVKLLDCNPLDNLYDESTRKGLFQDCINLVEVKDVVGTSDVRNMFGMFFGCSSLKEVPYFDTLNVERMMLMFNSCSNLESVPLFNTLNVKNMIGMFTNCSSLKSVPCFNTSNVGDMSFMFKGCSSLKSYTLPCNEYSTRSSVVKSYGDYKNCEKMLKGLKELWQV